MPDNRTIYTQRMHNNIIKKSKRIFFIYVIKYINEIIKEYKSNKKQIELLKLNYNKYVNKLKKESELNLFKVKLSIQTP